MPLNVADMTCCSCFSVRVQCEFIEQQAGLNDLHTFFLAQNLAPAKTTKCFCSIQDVLLDVLVGGLCNSLVAVSFVLLLLCCG